MLDHSGEASIPAAAGVGDVLRSTREAQGHTVADVAQALKLTQRQVDALESERFELLPGAAFARGFLRNYAKLLGLDPEPLLQSLARTDGVGSPELAPVCNAEGTMPAGNDGFRPFGALVAFAAIILLGAVALGWYFDWFAQPRETGDTADAMETPVAPAPVTPVPPSIDVTPVVIPDDAPALPADAPVGMPDSSTVESDGVGVPGEAVPGDGVAPGVGGDAVAPAGEAPQPAPETTAAPEAQSTAAEAAGVTSTAEAGEPTQRLVFRFSGESWVEVRDASNKIIFARTNRPGSVQEIQGEPPFRLVVGNAKDVALEYKGKAVDLAPHTKISVARLTVE
ncbi:RodZ domain-containing protein [Nitrogeniibacter aestuarii]|uniref:RodZ domain-containing protein n=1 Tax=Nitrogeniibacter aestuarii TaxID=2815343 RepID=UPI001E5DCB05|nr:RodZ domain-containing protein [Nitrogeniibacter aestuarii]